MSDHEALAQKLQDKVAKTIHDHPVPEPLEMRFYEHVGHKTIQVMVTGTYETLSATVELPLYKRRDVIDVLGEINDGPS